MNSAIKTSAYPRELRTLFISSTGISGKSGDTSADSIMKDYKFARMKMEVLLLLLRGKFTADIADEMVVTEKTVQNYINSLLSKTDMKSRAELVVKFIHINR